MNVISEADKAKIRKTRYAAAAVVGAAGPALAIALAEGGVGKWVAFAVAAATSLTAATGSAVAAKKTGAQVESGTFDSVDPVDQVINGLQAVTGTADAAIAARDAVTKAAADTLGLAVDVAAKVEQAINAARHA